MLEIYINPRRTSNLRQAVLDAIENGQYDTLADDIRDCFTEEQIEEIEERLESNDIDETIDALLSDWSGDNMEELLQEMDEIFAEADIDLTFDDNVDLDMETDDLEDETPDDDFGPAVDDFDNEDVVEESDDDEVDDDEEDDDEEEEEEQNERY